MRFNSIIGAIVFVLLSSILAMTIFIQTKSFGNLISRVISDVSEKSTDTKVAMSNIEISLFPPGIEMVKVSIQKDFKDGKTLHAELGNIGFYISLIEIEERKLTFGEIRMSDSVIDYNYPTNEEKEVTEIEQKLIDEIFAFSNRIPIRIDTLLVENTIVHANHDLLNIRRLKLFKQDDQFIARFHLANLKPYKEKDFVVDEVWADAEINRNDIHIQRLKIQHDVHSVIVKGKVEDYSRLKEANISINGEGLVYLKSLREIELSGPFDIKSGSAKVDFKLNMLKGKVDAEADLSIKDFRSNLIYADIVNAKLALQNDIVLLSYLDLSYKDQKLKVIEPVIVADIQKSNFLNEPVIAEVENLLLSNALRILGPSFKPLKGSLTGRISFRHDKGDLYFIPDNGFKINNLALIVGEEKAVQVLKASEVLLKDSRFSLVKKDFQMSSIIDLPGSQFKVDGSINKQGSKFSILDGKINLGDLGEIANLGLIGAGRLSVDVTGPLDDTELSFKGQMARFGVLGYQLGNADIDLNISLKDSKVTIKKLESVFGKTHLSGNGVVNYKNKDIALGINSTAATYHDLSQILQPVVSKLTFLPEDFELNANIDAYIHGKTGLDTLKVNSHIKFTDLNGYGENIPNGSFKVSLNNETVSITDFEGDKDKGIIRGEYSLGLTNKNMKVNFNWDNLNISSFNLTKKLRLNFDGLLVGEVSGEGIITDYILSLKNEITHTKSQNYDYPDSIFDVKIMPDRILGTAQILGHVIESEFDLSLSNKRKSSFTLGIDIPEVKPLAIAFLGQHLEHEEFSGRLGFDMKMSFNQSFNNLDMTSTLRELFFTHESFKVNYKSTSPQFQVTDSRIINWDLNIKEQDVYVVTKGSGTFGNNVSIVNEFHINSKLVEIMFSQVLSSEGFLRNIVRIDGSDDDYTISASSKSNSLSLSIEGVPIPLNDVKYSLDYSNDRLVIKEFIANLHNGGVSLKGDIFLGDNVPDVNMKYHLNRAEIPIMGKSAINITGEGIIIGNELPYNLGGELVINKALIVNELSDFNNKSVAQVRYLPKNQESILGKLFKLNLNVKAENAIRITNSLMDVALLGEVRILGSPSRPRGEGRLFSPVNSSRIFFKNNEYFISNADINFSHKKDITNPDFDIQATTFISSYKIYAKAYGDLERFNFDLTSDPVLARNSILSLIAFGYTDEIQSTLAQGEQQNLTQVGVGSFVFDRFKITDILNKQFGLQVNLGTVFEQSQTESMLSGRSQEGQGALGRTRSATKIELKKRLDEALTLSVSSTMGGSIGQRQSMNLTYSINKKVQLEGVYELRTNAEGEEDIIDNSIGGDLKFRWTFK